MNLKKFLKRIFKRKKKPLPVMYDRNNKPIPPPPRPISKIDKIHKFQQPSSFNKDEMKEILENTSTRKNESK